MKKIITTLTIVCALLLPATAFSQAMDAGVPAVVETAPVPTAPQPEAVPVVESVTAPVAAVAEAPAKAPAFTRLMDQVIEIIAALLMLMVAFLTQRATSYFTKKTKIEIPAKTEETIAAWGKKAVHYASEKGHQFAAEKGEAMKGSEKLEHALGFGLGLAEEYGMTNLAKDKLTKYIESHLGESRTASAS